MPGRESLLKRATRLYKKRGLTHLIYAISHYFIYAYVNSIKKFQGSGKLVLKDVLGSKMYLDETDLGLSWDLITDGIREAYLVEIVKKELKEGDIVIDIGANIGYYVLLESKIVGEKGKVYAIEPVPQNVDILRKNVKLNEYSNIEVFQLAIGGENGTFPIYVPSRRNCSTMITPHSPRQAKRIDVETVKLDDFIEDRGLPTVIRMDVEGYEYQIFKGMSALLEKPLPLVIFIEFHFRILTRDESLHILQTLKKAGFEITDAAFEGWTKGFAGHKTLCKIACFLHRRRYTTAPPIGFLNMKIDDIMSNDAILDGDWGALEICFKRLR